MDALFFATKRSYLASLRIARELVIPHGLTPARFDLLCALGEPYQAITLNELCARLGVSKATVSRMVKALEDLGFVQREHYLEDLRLRSVELTATGYQRMRAVIRDVQAAGYIELAIESAVAPKRVPDSTARAAARRALVMVRRLARGLGNRATFEYPWDLAA